MSVGYLYGSTTNLAVLDITVSDFIINNDSIAVNPFKDHGTLAVSNSLCEYLDGTGNIKLNKIGRYLIIVQLGFEVLSSVNTGSYVVSVGTNHTNTFRSNSIPSGLNSYTEQMNFIVTVDDTTTNNTLFVTVQNATNQQIRCLAGNYITQAPSFVQIIYLGP